MLAGIGGNTRGQKKQRKAETVKPADYLQIAYINIKQRKLRTALTVLGIVIAITTIFALISIGSGLENGVKEQFKKIGTNRLYVTAKGSGISGLQTGLTNDDVELLESMGEFVWSNPYLQDRVVIEYNNKREVLTVWGTATDNLEKRWKDVIQVQEGRLFKSGEKYSVIIGYKVATETFGRDIHINENVEIKGQRFKVIGIFEEIGNPEDDNTIQIPIEIMQKLFEKEGQVTIIELIAKDTDLTEIAKKATRVLERKKGEDTVDIITPDQLLQQFSTILSIVNTILGAIAGISLVVGGIGIMNSMYTSVMERKKEIGIMKAIGARNRIILTLFLTEAAIIGLVGGIIGILVGYCIGKLAQYGAEMSGFKILVITADPLLICMSIVFAVVFGIFAGFLPAREAMKKQVIEVLRKT